MRERKFARLRRNSYGYMQAFEHQPQSKYRVLTCPQSWSQIGVAGWSRKLQLHQSSTCGRLSSFHPSSSYESASACSLQCPTHALLVSLLLRWSVKTVLLRCRGSAAAGRFKFHFCTFTRSGCRLSAKGSLAFSIRPTRWLSSHR